MKKLKKILTGSALALLLILGFSVLAFAEDDPIVFYYGQDITGVEKPVTLAYGEKKYYSFDLATSGNISYEISSKEENMYFSISEKDSGVLLRSVTVYEGETKTGSVELNAGEYVVTLSNKAERDKECFFWYSVKFTSSKETYSGNNNEVSTASVIGTLGKTIIGHMAVNDREDFYRIKLTESGRLDVTLTGEADPMFWLENGKGEIVGDWRKETLDSGKIFKMDLAPGTYYLHFSMGNKYGVYKFKPVFKPSGETFTYANNSRSAVKSKTPIKLNQTVKGQLAANDAVDYYRLEIPKTGNYEFTVKSDSSYFSILPPFSYESMEKAGGVVVRAEGKYTDKANPPVERFIYTGLKKGIYYLHFECGDYGTKGTGPYSFVMKPARVEIYPLTAGTKQFTAKWVKGTGTGYQLQYALDSAFTKSAKLVTISKVSTVKKTVKNLKAKTVYYVRIRSYVTDSAGKKQPSVWSKKVKVRTK